MSKGHSGLFVKRLPSGDMLIMRLGWNRHSGQRRLNATKAVGKDVKQVAKAALDTHYAVPSP